MKKLKWFSILLCGFMLLNSTVFNMKAAAQNNGPAVYEVTVDVGASEAEIQSLVESAFEQYSPEVVIVNYVSMISLHDGYVTNQKSFFFLSYAYSSNVTVGGYVLSATGTVSGFNCSVVNVPADLITTNSIIYPIKTTTSAYAQITITLNGTVPHTYVITAPLYGTMTISG
jgi:hypothetical protein